MRSRKFNKRSIIVLIPLCAVLIFILYATLDSLISSLFAAKTIIIEGNQALVQEAPVINEKSLLHLDIPRLREDLLKQYPMVADITIRKQLPNTLYLKITERMPLVYWQGDTKIFIDKTGKILPMPNGKDIPTELINCSFSERAIGMTIADSTTLVVIKQASEFIEKLSEPIDKIACSSQKDTAEITISDLVILLPTNKENSTLVSSLQFLLKQFRIEGNRPKKIDLRFEKPVLISEVAQVASPSSESAISE